MRSTKVVIVDYGVGNLLSIYRAIEFCGFNATISSDINTILDATRVILAGVGAFKNGMRELKDRGLEEPIIALVNKGIPFLGICLGMQMLMDRSEEFGETQGLGLVSGNVIQIPENAISGKLQKIPHIGWSCLLQPENANWDSTLLRDIKVGKSVYFVHSYMAIPENKKHQLAQCDYGGHMLAAVVQKDNIVGCQFHPEKSGEVGLKILRNFLEQ